MRPDVVNYRQFYASPLGRRVRQRLRLLVHGYWGASDATVMVGIGYATPVLRVLERTAAAPRTMLAMMPASQGAIYWPVHSSNRTVLADEWRLPFAAQSLPHVLVLHALEYIAKPDEWLSQLWQLMAPGGRLLLMVPNRRGLWAMMGATPFAAGTPYTMAQLRELLQHAGFTLRDTRTALFAPPFTAPLWLRMAPTLEWLLRLCFPRAGGVLVVEAEKQIYAGLVAPVREPKRASQWAGVPA